ncbi:MAG TPA: TPM domain-containing protein [Gemmatimonadales bacterium]|nr:TPM domain-containing protein [Gemmatimonadales bacterium]
MSIVLCCALLQVAIPPPRGYVNDFAGVLEPAAVAHIEAVSAEVRDKTQGEIVVVTLADIGDRAPADVALQIGREWKVGPNAPAGDRARNLGVVILLVPRKNHRPGTGHFYIATGRGAEGFLTDAATGRVGDAVLPDMAREDYSTALVRAVDLVAGAFAREFGVTLSSGGSEPPAGEPEPQLPIPLGWIIAAVILLIVLSRGRILLLPFLFGGGSRGWGGGGGGWGGGGFGGGGGGFGGFGGGGGFSGGGAGRSF